MIYKVKIYQKKKKFSVVTIKCGDKYFADFKNDLFDNEVKFLDLDNIILQKETIDRIEVKEESEN